MHLTNNTEFISDYSTGLAKDGRRLLIIATKATYQIIPGQLELQLHEQQQPLIEADVSTGEPGYSATLYESDFSTAKSRCDVLLNGCAHAPNGQPATQVEVQLQVAGHINKSFLVKGNRTWSEPEPTEFSHMSISYDNAFGGLDSTDVKLLQFFAANPVGMGYSKHKKNIADNLLPNTEEIHQPVTEPDEKYVPMALGAIGRAWPLRAQYAGTYDEAWVKNTMPFYPDDFDFRHFQCAPTEQQMPYIKGGEKVELVNLSRHGRLVFHLPTQIVPVTTLLNKGQPVQYSSNVDTVIIEPDLDRVMMVSRAVIPLKNSLFDINEVIVGPMSRQWLHQQRTSKTFYQNLSDYVANQNK